MQTLNRVATCDAERDGESRLIEASLASDVPYKRDGYSEILDCRPAAVDLSRAQDGLPLILHHDRQQIAGRVYGIRADGRRVRGHLKFFDTNAGREAKAMVEAGHRELSVGYSVDKSERNKSGDLIATRWTLLEVSIVAIPADAGIGIARSFHMNTQDHDAAADAGNGASRSQRRQAVQADTDERDRVQAITAIGRAYSQWATTEMVDEAVRNGHSKDEFQNAIMTRMQNPAMDVTTVAAVPCIREHGDRMQRQSQFSLMRAVLAQVDPSSYMRGAGAEMERSQELLRQSPMRTDGIVMPMDSFFRRDMLAGTPANGGFTVQTNVDGGQWVDVLRQRSVCVGMGAQVLPGLSAPTDLPRKAASTTAAWLTENGNASEQDIILARAQLVPKRIGAYLDLSRQLIITSGLSMEQMIRQDLMDTVMAELDRVALVGTGASNQPRGIVNTSGIGAVVGGTNGATLAWGHVLDLENSVDSASGMVNLSTCGYAINSGTRSWLKRTPRHAALSEGLIMGDQPNDPQGFNVLNGYRCAVSAKLPSTLVKGTSGAICSQLIFGDWSQLVIAQFGPGVEIIVDPYSQATMGLVRITVNLFADVAVKQPGSFTSMDDAKLV